MKYEIKYYSGRKSTLGGKLTYVNLTYFGLLTHFCVSCHPNFLYCSHMGLDLVKAHRQSSQSVLMQLLCYVRNCISPCSFSNSREFYTIPMLLT